MLLTMIFLFSKKNFRMCGLGKKTRPRGKDQGQIHKAKTQAKTSADKTQAKASRPRPRPRLQKVGLKAKA